jgi:hypothetical protein
MRTDMGSSQSRMGRTMLIGCLSFFLCAFFGLLSVTSAQAATPWWHLSSNVLPAVLSPGGEGKIALRATNIGDSTTVGPVRLTDTLPAGLKVVEEEVEGVMVPSVEFVLTPESLGEFNIGPNSPFFGGFLRMCSVNAGEISCSSESPEGVATFAIAPYEDMEIRIKVKQEGASAGVNQIEVSGGSSHSATLGRSIPIGSEAPTFGAEQSDLSVIPEEEGGDVDALAGSHPFQLTTSLDFRQNADPLKPPGLPKDLSLALPAGLVGNATSLPQCSDHDFRENVHGSVTVNNCSTASVIGVAAVTIDEPNSLGFDTLPVPVFNLVPGAGEPARFGFEAAGAVITLDPSIRTGRDYGVTVGVHNLTQLAAVLSSTVTIWGAPSDRRHDVSRGWGCLISEHYATESGGSVACEHSQGTAAKPFLTLPTICGVPFATVVAGDSWPIKESALSDAKTLQFGPFTDTLSEAGRDIQLTGCDQLRFNPSVEAQLDTKEASSPAGVTVRVRAPQEAEGAEGRASSTIKDITVALPEGVTVNPASAGGLAACTETEIGFEGEEPGTGRYLFSPTLPEPSCPEASKIGTAEVITPLLPASEHLTGAVYLASQDANPFGSLIAFYLVVDDPVSGVLVKLPGKVSLDPSSGQITATITDAPPLPFQEAVVKFFGGSRAPLSSPALCRLPGEGYKASAVFGPWSEGAAVTSTSEFAITSGLGGGACPNPQGDRSATSLPFAPALNAGATSSQAGGYTSIGTHVTRAANNQELGALTLHLPPGLAASVASVTQCSEAQANEGTCGAASLIGHASVTVGVGETPFTVGGGQVFLTGPYRGAPFGLSITSPAKAGPFDLGKGVCDCVVVRASLSIDPHTAQVTVTTDATGPYAIPKMLEGIPLQIRGIDATVDRTRFAFNPTNCTPTSIAAGFSSDLGATSSTAAPFQVANCATLKFAPKFAVSTSGKTSKAKGASLNVKLTYPQGPQGTYANIARVKVDLPKQLPSQLKTLQRACTAAQFNANPAGCPAESKVGFATVHTPILPVPLSGPAIFVSHGNEAFPSLTMVLQGDNVTLDLVGTTFISKAGITSSTFKTVPDAPVGSFELNLPQGKYSALAANGNLCKSKLAMPTEFLAQNGAKINESTKISVTGCPRAKKAKRAKKKHASTKRQKGK